ncbi:MAG: hypothetical protein QOH60_5301 [Mycobacterium sp.]|jgi:hypothetical protein|nr:hypothetical protein [Mycobacterium sp.]
MERLPYIDEHATTVAASPADTWRAVLKMWSRDPDGDAPDVRTPFFALDDAVPMRRLGLKGRHWFSVYKLVFELDDDGAGRTRLSAHTWAAFPGLRGKVYRALVIGSGGHRIAVRLMLQRIAADARAHGVTA